MHHRDWHGTTISTARRVAGRGLLRHYWNMPRVSLGPASAIGAAHSTFQQRPGGDPEAGARRGRPYQTLISSLQLRVRAARGDLATIAAGSVRHNRIGRATAPRWAETSRSKDSPPAKHFAESPRRPSRRTIARRPEADLRTVIEATTASPFLNRSRLCQRSPLPGQLGTEDAPASRSFR